MKFPYNYYDTLHEFVEGRRKSFGYRRMSGYFYGSSGFAIRPSATDPVALEIIDGYQARNHRINPEKWSVPATLVTLYPDRFVFHQYSNEAGGAHSCMSRLINFLTHEHYYLVKYRKLATNATHMLVPSRTFEREAREDGTWGSHYNIPALGISVDNYWDKVDAVKEAAENMKSRGGFTYYRGTGPASHEPILKRIWIPEKRREYLRRLKDLHKHGEIRAKLGAFDETLRELAYRYTRGPHRSWSQVLVRRAELEQIVQQGDLEDHETYKSVLEHGATLVGLWRLPDTPEGIVRIFEIGLDKMKEPLRRNLGAVIYS